MEEVEETTLSSKRLRHRGKQFFYGPRKLTTITVALAEEDGPEVSATTTEALPEDEE